MRFQKSQSSTDHTFSLMKLVAKPAVNPLSRFIIQSVLTRPYRRPRPVLGDRVPAECCALCVLCHLSKEHTRHKFQKHTVFQGLLVRDWGPVTHTSTSLTGPGRSRTFHGLLHREPNEGGEVLGDDGGVRLRDQGEGASPRCVCVGVGGGRTVTKRADVGKRTIKLHYCPCSNGISKVRSSRRVLRLQMCVSGSNVANKYVAYTSS